MRPRSHYFAYARVSTVKQGQQGVSIEAQRDAILAYAQREHLQVVRWFEERVTAAKRGRPVFGEMVRLLRQGKAAGAIVHKIDRSTRNFHDWALLGDLIDEGIDVRFAHEPIDMHTRGGRLAADMMAVVAADFIRNQREETKKGLYGRLKQGVYPFRAPLGYLDQGAGKAKIPEPGRGHLIRRAFTLYDQGQHSLRRLHAELARSGLRSRGGRRVSLPALAKILRNPYYAGVIKIKATGEAYAGIHEPLVPMRLFERVQARLDGRLNARPIRHDYPFRRFLRCANCHRSLIGELQKGRVYYRCHTTNCPTTSVRQDIVEKEALRLCQSLCMSNGDARFLRERAAHLRDTWTEERKQVETNRRLRKERLGDRLNRLTDAYVDGVIDKGTFDHRKEALLREQRNLEQDVDSSGRADSSGRVSEYIELSLAAWKLYKLAIPAEKRLLLDTLTSNRLVRGRKLGMTLYPPFASFAKYNHLRKRDHYQNKPRTLTALLAGLARFCSRDEKQEPSHKKADVAAQELLHINTQEQVA